MTLPRLLLSVTIVALALPGCGDDDTDVVDTDGGLPMDADTDVDSSTPPERDMGATCPPGEPEPEAWDCSTDPGVADADPIEADADAWTWVPFDDAFCMDGSTTGIGINPNPESTKLLIFLEGGGACFDGLSCITVANSDGYDADKLASAAAGNTLGRGITDRTDGNNPFADWNFVYVPYCSGDAHSGTATDGSGFDGRTQTGHTNYQSFIERIAATFGETVDEVVLGGRSAGGLGTVVNYPITASAFGCTPVHMLNDSGALLSDTYLRPCLQTTTREVWGIAVPGECELCTCGDGGGLVNSFPYLARRYPDRNFALLSYTSDRTFRQFFSYGYSSGCNLPSTMPPEDYRAGLLEVRELMSGDANFQTFYVTGDSHTFTFGGLSGSFAGGVSLADWLEQFRTDDDAWTDVGP
ncbi:MAG: hypothetical protein JJ863_34540 [Deltaproteobacteria bacterium]|nr:hypothetical protein [Deltaproteobacteria bacterium]